MKPTRRLIGNYRLLPTQQKSISEGDLFVTDYIKTKQRLVKLEKKIDILELQLNSLKSGNKIINLFKRLIMIFINRDKETKKLKETDGLKSREKSIMENI